MVGQPLLDGLAQFYISQSTRLERENLALVGCPSRAQTVVGQTLLDGLAQLFTSQSTHLVRIRFYR